MNITKTAQNILKVFKRSDDTYLNTYSDPKDKYVFLNEYDNMNIYSLYPEMTIVPITKDNINTNALFVLDTNENNNDFIYRTTKMKYIYIKIKNKYAEFDKSEFTKYDKLKQQYEKQKISLFFHYHVIDKVRENLHNKNISNAWLKSYELYQVFDLIKSQEQTFKSFHICELPGCFIMALQYYVASYTDKKLEWVAQSLNPYNNENKKNMKGKYLPDQYNMAKNNKNNYDFGKDNTGDITNIDNIKHYHKKYGKSRDLVTSDCGQDSSEDFTTQEERLVKVYWGQFVCALGLLKKGANYFMKLFTVHSIKMIEIVYLCSLLFENVYICKPIKTTYMSGEVYMVCKNFLDIDTDNYLTKLYTYIENFDETHIVNLNNISNEFIDNLNNCNTLMGMRRLINFNTLIYTTNNFKFIVDNNTIKKHIDNIVEYYVKYYCEYYKLQ